MGDMAYLRVNAEQLGDVQEVAGYLDTLAQVYNHLYAFDFIYSEAKVRHQGFGEHSISPGLRGKPVRTLAVVRKPAEVVVPEERVRIQRIVIKSPGFWEFLGKLNPLEVIRVYLCDRHERKKDIAYRNRQEEEKGNLENAMRLAAFIREQATLLREYGVPEAKIRKALFEHVTTPLRRLDAIQDKGLITNAELHDGAREDSNPKKF